MPLTNGQTFAGYKIIRLLGSGGMGEVYLAQHPRLPRRDALKLLPRDWSGDAEYRARFNREADLASTLWHPHIVGVHDRGEQDGQLWISMDYVDGLDAAQLLADRYPAGMPVEEVMRIVSAMASALDSSHKQGLLHRDVKPANIMLTHVDDDGEQRILLTDFGIARNVNDISGLTATNMTVGTVAYCAPEQLLGEDIDGRADQYSLAATAYHLLTGAQLFANSNPAVVISRHLNNPPPSLEDIRPELAKLDPALAIALAKHPEGRFARCIDFARALTEHLGTTSAQTSAAQTRPAPAGRHTNGQAASLRDEEVSGGRRRPVWVALACSVLVGILVGGLVFWRPWSGQQSPISSAGAPTPATTTDRRSQPAPSPLPKPPSRPPSFAPKSIDAVLLTATQLSRIAGAEVTTDPAAAGGGIVDLALSGSSYGTADHSGQVTPQSCAGVVFTADHDVYAANQPAAMKTQTFGHVYNTGNNTPHLITQAAAVFSDAAQAQAFLASSQEQWETCSKEEVDATLGFENGAGYILGDVERDGEVITVSMATNGGENGPDACQQALGVSENVVVESRSCQVPDVQNTYDPSKGWEKNPSWASPYAQRIVKAMLMNVTS
jgi:serine/threonine-protein kinase